MSFTLCIKHHAYIGDEIHEEAVVEEEPRVVELDDPNDNAQGRTLCIPML